MRGRNCSFKIEKGRSSNELLQLEFQINSISLKNGITTSVLFTEKTLSLKILDHYKWSPEIMTYFLKITIRLKQKYLSNNCIYTIYGCKCSSKTIQNPQRRNGWPQLFCEKRNTVLWKKLFPAIKHSKMQRKNVFRNN